MWKERWQENSECVISFGVIKKWIVRSIVLFLHSPISECLRDVLLDVFILGACKFANVTVENHLAVTENQKTHRHVAILAARQHPQLIGLRVEFVRSQGEGILQAVSDQQRTGAVNIALLHD